MENLRWLAFHRCIGCVIVHTVWQPVKRHSISFDSAIFFPLIQEFPIFNFSFLLSSLRCPLLRSDCHRSACGTSKSFSVSTFYNFQSRWYWIFSSLPTRRNGPSEPKRKCRIFVNTKTECEKDLEIFSIGTLFMGMHSYWYNPNCNADNRTKKSAIATDILFEV